MPFRFPFFAIRPFKACSARFPGPWNCPGSCFEQWPKIRPYRRFHPLPVIRARSKRLMPIHGLENRLLIALSLSALPYLPNHRAKSPGFMGGGSNRAASSSFRLRRSKSSSSFGPFFGIPGTIPELFHELFPYRLELVGLSLRRGGRVDPGRAHACRAVLGLPENPYQFSKCDALFQAILDNLARVYPSLARVAQPAPNGAPTYSEQGNSLICRYICLRHV